MNLGFGIGDLRKEAGKGWEGVTAFRGGRGQSNIIATVSSPFLRDGRGKANRGTDVEKLMKRT